MAETRTHSSSGSDIAVESLSGSESLMDKFKDLDHRGTEAAEKDDYATAVYYYRQALETRTMNVLALFLFELLLEPSNRQVELLKDEAAGLTSFFSEILQDPQQAIDAKSEIENLTGITLRLEEEATSTTHSRSCAGVSHRVVVGKEHSLLRAFEEPQVIQRCGHDLLAAAAASKTDATIPLDKDTIPPPPPIHLLGSLVLLESDVVDKYLQQSLKRVDDKLQNLIDQQDLKQLTDSKFLKSIVQDIKKIFTYLWTQILQSIYNQEYPGKEDSENISYIFEKGMILYALHKVGFLINFFCIHRSCFFKHPMGYSDEYVIELLVIQLSELFFCYLGRVVDDETEEDDVKVERSLLESVIGRIHDAVKCYSFGWRLLDRLQYNETPSRIIDGEVAGFFNWLIDALRMQGSPIYMVGDNKDPIDATIEELRFLRNNLLVVLESYTQEEVSAVREMESLSVSTLALLFETASRIYSGFYGEKQQDAYDSSSEEEAAHSSYCGFHDFLESVGSLKKQATDLFRNCKLFSLSSSAKKETFSDNHMEESVDSLHKHLQDLIVHDAPSITPLRTQMEAFYHEMTSIRGCLIHEIVGNELGKSQMELLIAQVKEAARNCSLIIDSFSAGKGSLWYHMLGMFIVTNDIRAAGKEIKYILKVKEEIKPSSTNWFINLHQPSTMNLGSSTAQSPPAENPNLIGDAGSDDIVGLKDSASEAIQILTQRAPQLNLVSIVGMPGLGKTTLANSVYKHPSISFQFHVRAWCCVSQVYERETLLADILSQIVGRKTSSSNEEDRGEHCAQKLYQSLKGRKYLIVIDDIWDADVWYDLKNIFPDDHTGSRILFTTPHRHVASRAHSIPYALRLLSDKESCELLWSKVFGRETCPPKLLIVSKRIAKHCKGLPLLITVMSGILKSKERSKESWELVAEEQEPKFGGLISLHGRSIHYISNQGSKFGRVGLSVSEAVLSNKLINTGARKLRGQSLLQFINTQSRVVQSNYNFLLWHEFLLVLDLGNVRVESGADSSDLIMIATLIHLRYLSIRIRTTEIPSDIGNLRNLETLIITGAIGYILLPESVWNLFQLRNILMNHGFFDFQHFSKTFFDNFVEHDNLKSVSTLSLRHGDDVDKLVLSKLTGIKKLGCKFYADSWDDSRGCSLFPDLDFMSELVSLKVIFSGKVQYPYKISFPSNLRKLSISNSRLPWEELSVIGRQLPNLEVLKLLNKAFEGQQWDMIDGEFQKLKFLKLDFLEIEVWNACAEHLPCLEQLVVSSCPQLMEIPSSFGEISTLQSIEVKWCSPSAITSVNQILELQLDLGNPQFNVTLVGLA
ncbi:OLC1v1017550C1 [Oldenlandia corymbosa var. corymbosa]|uniref:OLC1v1017550C1 n=1 Tax=Oldenlandia corymbosa var. corymbosa TaxID=529605 RepID=A0AAV1E9R1_OLDCO|nr:OLC1v1017550C1 [Oldenlandia corymbosa var. corymbosa]